jgi:hypothetical protein
VSNLDGLLGEGTELDAELRDRMNVQVDRAGEILARYQLERPSAASRPEEVPAGV